MWQGRVLAVGHYRPPFYRLRRKGHGTRLFGKTWRGAFARQWSSRYLNSRHSYECSTKLKDSKMNWHAKCRSSLGVIFSSSRKVVGMSTIQRRSPRSVASSQRYLVSAQGYAAGTYSPLTDRLQAALDKDIVSIKSCTNRCDVTFPSCQRGLA